MNLAYSVYRISIGGDRNAHARVCVLLASKGDVETMYAVFTNEVEDFGVLFACGAERSPSRRHVVEQIFNRNLCSLSASGRLGVCGMAWLRWNKLAIGILCFPRTARFLGFGRHGQMRDVANARQCFSSEAIRSDGRQIIKRF